MHRRETEQLLGSPGDPLVASQKAEAACLQGEADQELSLRNAKCRDITLGPDRGSSAPPRSPAGTSHSCLQVSSSGDTSR